MTERVISLTINGVTHTAGIEPRWLLSDVLRHQMGIKSVHVGCEQGVCGACTVLLEGEPVRSCLLLAVQAEGHAITTIDGITPQTGLSALEAAFQQHHAVQCGYCTPGILLTAHALLLQNPHLDSDAVRQSLSGNLCRCTGYQFIIDAILHEAQKGGPEHA